MADTRQELEGAVFDLAARVASVRAALSGATTNDRGDVLEGCYRVLGDKSQMKKGAAPKEGVLEREKRKRPASAGGDRSQPRRTPLSQPLPKPPSYADGGRQSRWLLLVDWG